MKITKIETYTYWIEWCNWLFVKVLTNVKDTVTLSNIQISCITTVKRNSAQLSGVDVIIVGTELGSIYWVDSQAYSLLSYAQIQGVPEKLLAFGWMLHFFVKHI